MLPFARNLAEVLKPGYGIGYTQPQSRGPTFYAVGLNLAHGAEEAVNRATDDTREDDLAVARWGNAMTARIWERGIFRDVYPWNFLTQPQLSRKVNDLPLQYWIQQDLSRGKLEPLCEGIWFWEVEQNVLSSVRRAAQEAGLIFDWRRHLR